MRHLSPLRYPGGKACLAGLLEDVIDLNDLRGAIYFEPYAGGAGAALTLLQRDSVAEIVLNDADYRVYAFWQAVLKSPDRFLQRLFDMKLNIAEWQTQKEICLHPRKFKQFDVGFAAFILNRCNRSGVITGAGPIGGMSQSGEWRMDVRFNVTALAERIQYIKSNRNRIRISNLDAIDFLKKNLPRGNKRSKVFVYLDPPYVEKGQRLYLNSYDEKDHCELHSYIAKQRTLNWLMSYDDNPLIRVLYKENDRSLLDIDYTLQSKRTASELIIAPLWVRIPRMCRIGTRPRLLKKVA